MSDWRKVVKDYFKTGINDILKIDDTKEYAKFDIWNSNIRNEVLETSIPRTVCYFEFSAIEDEQYFSRMQNIQSSGVTPVNVTLHLTIRNYKDKEKSMDELWRLADLAVQKFNNKRIPDCTFKRITKISEVQDVLHSSLMEHQITFGMRVFEDVASDNQKTFIGDNPDIVVSPKPEIRP